MIHRFQKRGDRRPPISHGTSCRLYCERNWTNTLTLNVHLQIFNASHTLLDNRWEDLSEEDLSKILDAHLGRDWELITKQHFRDWFIHLYEKPEQEPGGAPKLAIAPQIDAIAQNDGVNADTQPLLMRHAGSPVLASQGQRSSLRRRAGVVFGVCIGILGLGMWGWRLAPHLAIDNFSALHMLEQAAEMHSPMLGRVTEQIRQSITISPARAFETPPDSFERAVAIAQQAVVDGRVAESADAWKHLSRQWWSAAEFMAEVPPTDERYAIAQDRVNQYRHHSDYAVLETAKHTSVLPISSSLAESTKRVSDTEQPERDVSPDDQPYCQNAIHTRVQTILNTALYEGSKWGIHIESISTGEVLYGYNSDTFLIPASNVKLFTTASASFYNQTQHSQDIRMLIHSSNLDSNNGSAELLFNQMGGAMDIKNRLHRLGIDPSGYHQADGSGLSRQNLATPRSLVQILRLMYHSPHSEEYVSTLPIASKRGTLHGRFHLTPASGRVMAKTGTLSGVRSLSGYLNHPTWGMLTFSILANHPHQSGDALLPAIDAIVLQVMQLAPCDKSP